MHRSEAEISAGAADSTDTLTSAIERAYRLILGRSADAEGAAGYLRALRAGELSVSDVCASLAASEEFANRLRPAEEATGAKAGHDAADAGTDPDWVDVKELLRTTSVEELARRAEGYFQSVDDENALLAKPLSNMREAPDLLATFAQVLRGLRPLPGMTVLDFGAGTGWTSRFLTQLGCRVKSLDVSPTALSMGRRLFRELPVLGHQPEPEFLVYDGHRFDLPDGSVDRILCFDALHHVPNTAEVIEEMARVLRPGGIAAFSEPGDRHSAQPQSQYEMRNFGIIENDVLIEDIWECAQQAGFVEMRLCLFDAAPQWVDLRTFQDVVSGRESAAVLGPTHQPIGDRRMFWLRRAGSEVPDSREAEGLLGELAIEDVRYRDSGHATVVTGTCRVRNPGPRTWLPSDAEFGPVRLGVRVHLGDHTVRDLARVALPGSGVYPGEGASFALRVEVPAQPEGIEALEFDLISENVCWFSINGSPVARFPFASPC